MGDKSSKTQWDEDDPVPPHLARTDFRFNSSDQLSFSGALPLDANHRSSYRSFHSRLHEPSPSANGVVESESSATTPVNTVTTVATVNSAPEGSAPMNFQETSIDSPMTSHKVQPASDNGHSSSVDSTASQSLADNSSHNSIEPPSPSTSSTKTVISVTPGSAGTG